MSLSGLVEHASDKTKFETIESYVAFATAFLEYVPPTLQAVIVSRNEPHYTFWQYPNEGRFGVTRPINSTLMFTAEDEDRFNGDFLRILSSLREDGVDTKENRECLNRSVYTIQQCIGAALDALPEGMSNKARKINALLRPGLVLHVLAKNLNRGTAGRDEAVAWRPEDRLSAVGGTQRGELLSQKARGDRLEHVDEVGRANSRRHVDERMDVVDFARAFEQGAAPRRAQLFENPPASVEHPGIEDTTPILGDQHQVIDETKDGVEVAMNGLLWHIEPCTISGWSASTAIASTQVGRSTWSCSVFSGCFAPTVNALSSGSAAWKASASCFTLRNGRLARCHALLALLKLALKFSSQSF